MAFDAHKNLAISTVVTAPSPATSGTSLVVTGSEGARFPVPPFNATVWPSSAMPTPANAEVVRVTARTTDTLTIARAQEGTTARAMAAGDLIAASITAKTLTDLETRAALKDELNVFTQNQRIDKATPRLQLIDTAPPADQRHFELLNYNQTLRIAAVNDIETVTLAQPLLLSRTGDAYVGRDLYEKGRGVALGHWTTGDASTIAQTPGFTGPVQWMMIGRTLFLIFTATGSPAGAAVYNFNLPVGGLYAAATFSIAANVQSTSGGNWRFGSVHFTAANYYFSVYQSDLTAWPAGAKSIQFFVALSTQ